MPDIKQIHWSQLPGNKYNKNINALMLLPGGVEEMTVQKLTYGHKSKFAESEVIVVTYDREYAINWLRKKVLEKIKPSDDIEFATVLEMLKEAYDDYKDKSSKDICMPKDIGNLLSQN